MFTRRAFVGKLVTALGAVAAGSLGGCSPSPGTPFRKTEIEVEERASMIRAKINADREPYFQENGRFYVVAYPLVRGRYIDQGVVVGGLMALRARCPYDGCVVPFCVGSQWFECRCGGDKFNRAGEYRLGPSTRGMDRIKMRLRDDRLTVLMTEVVPGPPRGIDTIKQEKEGPFCV